MVDNNELREYAIKCYKRVIGYSLEKAAKLFPKEFPKILMYYNQYAYNDTMKLAESMRSVVFFNEGIRAMNTIAGMMEQDAYYFGKMLEFNKRIDDAKTIDEFANVQKDLNKIYSNMTDYLKHSLARLDQIKKFANQYGFTSILKDVRDLTIDYNNQLNEINEFLKPRRDNDNG